MSALGYTPMIEVYGVVRDSRANLDRIRRHGEMGWGETTESHPFLSDGQVQVLPKLTETEGGAVLEAVGG